MKAAAEFAPPGSRADSVIDISPPVGQKEADSATTLPVASDSAVTQSGWARQADADAAPLPLLKLPAAQGVHAVETAAEEKVDGGHGEQSVADWLPICVPTNPAPQGVQLPIPSRSAYDPAAQRVATPP